MMTQHSSRARIRLLTGAALLFGSVSVPAMAQSPAKEAGAFGAYLAGHFALQSHDVGLAAAELERAATGDPGIPELSNQAFLAALLAGQPQVRQLAARLPTNPLAQLVLADSDAVAGNWTAAEAIYVAMPQPDALLQVLHPLLIAWAQQGMGQTDQALAGLQQSIDGPQFGGVYALHAAMIADLAGRDETAARLYARAATAYGSTNLRLAVILASWRARHGELDAAQRAIDELGTIDGDLAMARPALTADMSARVITTPADGIAEAYLVLAATVRPQNAESARIMLQLALRLRPGLVAAKILLADIEAAENRPQDALATLQGIAATDPLAPLVALRRAALLSQTGQTDAAKQQLVQLAREYPTRPEPLMQEGDLLRRDRHFAEAAKVYDEAISRLSTPNRGDWPLFYSRGISLERSGQWPKAEEDFQYALKLAPDQPSILNYLAYSWAERGEHLDDARKMLQEAIDARPNDGAILDSLGWVMLRQGDSSGALAQLQHAVQLEPEDAVINGHLGDALAAAGRIREAEFQWRRALILKPEEEDAKRIEAKLAALPDPALPTNTAVSH